MDVEFDRAKDAANAAKHGVSLGRASDLEILVYIEDNRRLYGETRYRAWGKIDGSYYCLAFTRREGRLRGISLRRAHQKEIDRYVATEDGSR
jgi:uncharacterized protein